jgi:hypothetical protein
MTSVPFAVPDASSRVDRGALVRLWVGAAAVASLATVTIFDADLGLQYRGRLDASKTQPVPDARRELFEAMLQIARTGQGPREQIPSMGCSIKWRYAA